ncbi:DUF2892 domain-containing protein [Rhodoplanes serenus]|jgi:hypothetical protein|uniref:DUF2892 domain-containing protein n=1 Tax=Rhodoplanes serenus TaxID=200615 RepID=A0A327KAG3_9BRAD|nr:DUF2892 domain-containing protein [Rhodoplanes serenus]MBI5110795.1 DUF2892 domain-containing protein [Rhodovulum sp.]MTW17899.1 DUF2892 domain-containing protein [Rhodoplanes serenus]RAI35034.1 hypothetical protein CH340_07195 [Rhodoplanes serenus]VCU11067.1 hypothetical protein RHODGE_RHODGE_04271 [Rhodoplanes serenus]
MTKNMGMMDRLVRAVVGFGLVYWALTGGPMWAWIGLVPLATAAISYCPAYTIFGINTCPTAKS